MICLGNKVIDGIFLGSKELNNAYFGENQTEDFLPYILSDNTISLDAEGSEIEFTIQSNINYTII